MSILDNLLSERKETHRPLIVTHRGTSAGIVQQNTVKAALTALASGSDIVELDVISSADGQYYAFHDDYEKYLLGSPKPIQEFTSKQVDGLSYRMLDDYPLGQVERFEDCIKALKGRLVNVDRSWRYWDKGFLSDLSSWGNNDDLLLKSPAEKEWLDILDESDQTFPFIAIVKDEEQLDLALSYNQIGLFAIELIAADMDSPFVQKGFIDSLHDKGLLVWANAINLENNVPLFAGYDDLTSIQNPDKGWGVLVDLGVDFIQTDMPWLLDSYLKNRF